MINKSIIIFILSIKIKRRKYMSMKFVKGMVVGGLISAGVAMMCSDCMQPSRKKMVKMGKQFARKMGIM